MTAIDTRSQDLSQQTFKMNDAEFNRHKEDVTKINHEMFEAKDVRTPRQSLGKDDFLQLLMKQLAYQDPMAPMEDKEFIAQMAQFSSLEQMTAMSQGFTKLSGDFSRIADMISGSAATGALGKSVELTNGDSAVQGVVRAVTRGGNPQVLINGNYYNWDQVTKVFEE
ncbi:MAG: flagellar hook assembly protein FlgD [Treponema sp.]|jgi:flagellar basal-body rod modification protein FlgD|nr:flagellar hook assembly protein FlgD [Treponema sp.]